jgi:iron complex transport system substrate-binding protein
MSRRKVKFGVIFLAFAIAIAGVNPAIANEKISKYPLTLVSAGFETKLEKKPTRIISLSPSATEILFAIKAGPQVLAVDDNSNFPAEIPKSELSSFTPNVEAIAAMKPDLVVLQINASNARNVQSALSKLEIPVFVEPSARNLTDTYREISLLGLATDRNSAANSLINVMKKRISKTIKSTRSKEKKTFFHELDNTLYTATSKTFIGRVYKDLGLINIADAAASADKSGYPQLSAEYLINSNPNFIFLSNAQYGESKDTVSARPGWKTIDAVKSGRIIELPADIPSRWGPRIADFYEFVAKEIKRS